MTTTQKSKVPWVTVFDGKLNRWVSFDEVNEDWYRRHKAQEYFERWNHPLFWKFESDGLHESAHRLWNAAKLKSEKIVENALQRKIALMLAGMSLECAIKTRLIASCRFPLNEGDRKRIFSGRHDLCNLVKSAQIKTNDRDREVLDQLSVHVLWLGRYPTPRNLEEMVKYSVQRSVGVEWDQYVRVREKIEKSVWVAIRRWPSKNRST